MAKRKVSGLVEGNIVYSEVNSKPGQVVETMLRENMCDLIDQIIWDESFTKLALFYKGLPETSVFSYALPVDWQNNLQVGTELTFIPDNWYNELLSQ